MSSYIVSSSKSKCGRSSYDVVNMGCVPDLYIYKIYSFGSLGWCIVYLEILHTLVDRCFVTFFVVLN